jgi:bifunctional non-homologous end joining protein LigD
LIKGRDEFAVRGEGERKPAAAPAARRTTTKAKPAARKTAAARLPKDVEVTNPGKVMFPGDGFTKADVIAYYRKVAPRLLPFLRDRPVTLERLPDGLGAGKPHFWQKHTPPSYPDWIPRAELQTEQGKPVNYVLVNDEPTLLYLVNQGTLTFHPWLSRLADPDRPDFVLFDLDPGEASFDTAVAVANELHRVLGIEGHEAAVKTSGKAGLHVLVPWREKGGFDEARDWALDVAIRVAESFPDGATVEIRKARRGRRVYIDVMQNARGHHAVPPYVLRPVPGAPVSTPLRWDELKPGLDPKRFNLRTAPARFARQKRDPLAGLLPSG